MLRSDCVTRHLIRPAPTIDTSRRARLLRLSIRTIAIGLILGVLGASPAGPGGVAALFALDRAAIAAATSAPAAAGPKSPPFAQVYLILDSSASMMVGATPGDEERIAAWVASHKDQVFVADEDSPCAFACHDRDRAPLSVTDMQQGEAVAHLPSVAAATRFDRVKLALVNDPRNQDFCGGKDQIACDFAQPPGLLAEIRDRYAAGTGRVSLGNFRYNMYGFNEGIDGDEPDASILTQDVPDFSQYAVTDQPSLAPIAAGVNRLTIGLDTHLNPPVFGIDPSGRPHRAVLPALVDLVGGTRPGAGSSADNPLKFVIIVTDGLSSDRNWNYGAIPSVPNPFGSPPAGVFHPPPVPRATYCALWDGPPPVVHGVPAWQGTDETTGATGQCRNNSYSPGFLRGPSLPNTLYQGGNHVFYAQPLDPGYCAAMKDNSGQAGPGVTVAVLETPYIPLTGQDPPDGYPYETGVQRIIYPDGNPATHPGSVSALSTALKSCASSPEYYFQAADDSAIASGIAALFDAFVTAQEHRFAAAADAPPAPPSQAQAAECQPADMDATGQFAHLADQQMLVLRFRNRSDHACIMSGLDSSGLSAKGAEASRFFGDRHPVVFCYLCSETDRIPAREKMPPMDLAPGQSAYLPLEWSTEGRFCGETRSIAVRTQRDGMPDLELASSATPLKICSAVRYAPYRRDPPELAASETPADLTLSAADSVTYTEERPLLHAELDATGPGISAELASCPEPLLLERTRGANGETKIRLMAAPRRADPRNLVGRQLDPVEEEGDGDRPSRRSPAESEEAAAGFPGILNYAAHPAPGPIWQDDIAYVSACGQGLQTIAASDEVAFTVAAWPWGPPSDGFAVALALHKDSYLLGDDIPLRIACTQTARDWTPWRGPPLAACGVEIEIRDEAGELLRSTDQQNSSRFDRSDPIRKGTIVAAGRLSLGSERILPNRPGTYQITATWTALEQGVTYRGMPPARSLPVTLHILDRP
jgi:hypothetical protein